VQHGGQQNEFLDDADVVVDDFEFALEEDDEDLIDVVKFGS